MYIKGRVFDKLTGVALPGASITVIDEYGKSLGIGVQAGNDGGFGLSSSAIDVNFILVTHVEYDGVILAPDLFIDGPVDIPMTPYVLELPEVVVTPGGNKPGKGWLWLLFLASVGVTVGVISHKDKKRKKMSYAR
jgi:hypothetical protein